MASNTLCWAAQAASLMPSRSLRSAPAQKARSPAPVSTRQRAASMSTKAAVSSSAMRELKALEAPGARR